MMGVMYIKMWRIESLGIIHILFPFGNLFRPKLGHVGLSPEVLHGI